MDPLLPLDEKAGWLTALVAAAAVLWKVWLRFKIDKRTDQSASRSHDAEGNVLTNYDNLIKQLRTEVDRLAVSVSVMSKALDEERRARYAAERLASELKLRVDMLEQRLRELGHTP